MFSPSPNWRGADERDLFFQGQGGEVLLGGGPIAFLRPNVSLAWS